MSWKLCIVFVLSLSGLMTHLTAFEKGDWLIRARALSVTPHSSSESVSSIPKSKIKVGRDQTAELDFTYMWTENVGTELVLATTKHSLRGKKSLAGVKIGTIKALPPSLMLQYHFFPTSSFQPYIGYGINFTKFYHKHCSIKNTKLHLKNSWGAAFQVGVDYMIDQDWFFNVDVKYIMMGTKAMLSGAVSGHAHVNVNPWLVGIGIGRRF